MADSRPHQDTQISALLDKAGTESDDAAFTAGALLHILKDNRFVIEHVVRGQWRALDREEKIKFWAERDRANLSRRRQL